MSTPLTRELGVFGATMLGLGSIVGSVILTAYAPRVLGDATDELFAGVIGARLPDGITKEQAVAGLRAKGDGTFADMVSSMNVVPGQGVDFGVVGRILLTVLALYLGSAVLGWLGAYLLNIVVVGTIAKLRELSVDMLVMSGSRDEGNIVGKLKPSPLPPGRGTLVSRDAGTQMIQVCSVPPVVSAIPGDD